MAFSGGTYSLPAGNPVVTSTVISSSWANTTLSDIATALSTCILKDGTQTVTANIPMAGFKFTGLGAGSSANDSVRVAQLQAGTVSYLTGTAGTNTITALGSPTVTALTTGQNFRFIPANTNTAATTLQIDSTSALSIFWNNVALVGGELRANVPVEVMYDGTQFQLLASGAHANTFAIPDTMRIQAAGDRTKMFVVSVTGVPTSTIVTMAAPATGGSTIVGDNLAQTLTNKTINSPTIDSATLNTLVTGSAIATKTVMVSGSSISTIVSPGNQHFHQSAVKGWGYCISPTTVQASYPPGATVANGSAGNYTITHGLTFASTNYCAIVIARDAAGDHFAAQVGVQTTTTFPAKFWAITAGAETNPNGFFWMVYGPLA